ncbi:MAG: T9SS type A sorting domain-containing protein [Chloroflexota bacterium]
MKRIKTKLIIVALLLLSGGLFAQEFRNLYDYREFLQPDRGIFAPELYRYSISPLFNPSLRNPIPLTLPDVSLTKTQASVKKDTIASTGAVARENVALEVYPNSDGSVLEVHLRSGKPGYVSIAAYNMLGKQVADIVTNQYSEKNLSASYFVGSLPRGMYIVVATKNGERTAQKIVID